MIKYKAFWDACSHLSRMMECISVKLMTVTHYMTLVTFSRYGFSFKGQGQTFSENAFFSWRHRMAYQSIVTVILVVKHVICHQICFQPVAVLSL